MTARIDSLRALEAAVKAGEAAHTHFMAALHHGNPGDFDVFGSASHAYRGSLDAALALHNAVLPGWHITDMWMNGDGLMGGAGVWHETAEPMGGPPHFSAHAPNMARELLLAILAALIAMEG